MELTAEEGQQLWHMMSASCTFDQQTKQRIRDGEKNLNVLVPKAL
jgi:hypothetical protein